jgi:hypothetical protein
VKPLNKSCIKNVNLFVYKNTLRNLVKIRKNASNYQQTIVIDNIGFWLHQKMSLKQAFVCFMAVFKFHNIAVTDVFVIQASGSVTDVCL